MEIETRLNFRTILHSIKNKSPPDFTIINYDKEYKCHFRVLAISSRKISSMQSGQYHPASLTLKTKNKLHFLQDVIDFFYGQPIIFDFTNYKEISILSNYFDSEYLKNITTRASSFFEYSQNLLKSNFSDLNQPEFDFFASFFHVFSKSEEFKRFPFEVMKSIITSDELMIVSEDFLVHWILHEYEDSDSRPKLLNFVFFQKVSPKGFKDIFTSLRNIDEFKEKMQTEFIKNPKNRNLSLDRNPRYLESSEILNQKILNFDFSQIFNLDIEFPENETEVTVLKKTKKNTPEMVSIKNSKDSQKNFFNRTQNLKVIYTTPKRLADKETVTKSPQQRSQLSPRFNFLNRQESPSKSAQFLFHQLSPLKANSSFSFQSSFPPIAKQETSQKVAPIDTKQEKKYLLQLMEEDDEPIKSEEPGLPAEFQKYLNDKNIFSSDIEESQLKGSSESASEGEKVDANAHVNGEGEDGGGGEQQRSPAVRRLKRILTDNEADKLLFDSSDKDSDFDF